MPASQVHELVQTGQVDPTQVLTHIEPVADALDEAGWMKVELEPAMA